MIQVLFDYWFHAVGQGLFTSGRIYQFDNFQKHFCWIFDCGTKSKIVYLDRELDHFKQKEGNNSVGLMCLSHFDEDHINGASRLLSSKRVETLVLPYFPLTSRMLIALSTPTPSADYLRFLVDPVSYIFSTFGENVGQLILIEGGPSSDGEDESVGQVEGPPENWDLQPPPTKRPGLPIDPELYANDDQVQPMHGPTYMFGHEKPFHVAGHWEFMFYNEHKPEDQITRLKPQVVETIRKHRNVDGTLKHPDFLRELKQIYAGIFGISGEAKNVISLVTYTGPVVHKPDPTVTRGAFELYPASLGSEYMFPFPLGPLHEKPSALYTGDFLLTTTQRLNDLKKHFGDSRCKRIGVFQVPHHGADSSWYKGASSQLGHNFSIFSARRNSKYHPGQMVVADLETHCPIFVNEFQRFQYWGVALCGRTVAQPNAT